MDDMDKPMEMGMYEDPCRRARKKPGKQKRTRKVFTFLLVVLFLYFGTVILQNQYRLYLVNQRVDALRQEIQLLESQREELLAMREYVESQEYIEYKARRELDLIRDGERVLVLTDPGDPPDNEFANTY